MSTADAYEITWLVRRLFRAMASRSNASLQNLGITAADRAVLEFLHAEDSLSVPEIAARYEVSRQHVQVTVNRLRRLGLVDTVANPRHKRSPLVVLTPAGRQLFERILVRDREIIATLFAAIPPADVSKTRITLQRLLDGLTEGASR